jgi:hypothetical protein
MVLMASMFIASTAMSIYGASQKSKAAQKSAQHQQMLLNMKAGEMSRRSKENLALMQEQGTKAIGKAQNKMSSGRYGRVGSESIQQQVDDSYSNLFKQIDMQKKRDDWDNKMIGMGADAAGERGRDARKAGYWDMASTAVNAGMQGAQMQQAGMFG